MAIDYEVASDPAAEWFTLNGTLQGTLAPGETVDITYNEKEGVSQVETPSFLNSG